MDGKGGQVQVSPGVMVPIPGSTRDIFDSFKVFGLCFKGDPADKFSYVLSIDQPYGVRTDYPQGFYQVTTTSIKTITGTAMLAYDPIPDVKLYAGLRVQHMKAHGDVPFLGGYKVQTDADIGFCYLVGLAYQRPAMAQRVALTY